MWKSVRILAALVAAFAVCSHAAWDGSPKTPKKVTQNDTLFYEITSPEELVGFLKDVRAAEDMYEVNAYLKNDIVFGADSTKLSEKVFDFENAKYFQSTFDGRGHTIYGMNSVHPLFKIVGQGGGRVANLNIANSVFGNDTVYSAATVAEENQGIIENVNVYNTKVRGALYAGGIVTNTREQMKFPNVYVFNCNVIGGTVEAALWVGGVVGYAASPVMKCTNSATVRYVYSKRVISVVSETVYIGGVIGFFGGAQRGIDLTHCVNRGTVELSGAVKYAYVGGVAGDGVSYFENVRNEGNVTVNVSADEDVDSAYVQVGGIAGWMEAPVARDLINKGKVSASMDSKLAYGKMSVGGIAGRIDILGISNSLNLGSVEGTGFAAVQEVYAGGIAGYARYVFEEPAFSKIKNRASVNAEGTFSVFAGGLFGEIQNNQNPGPRLIQSFNYGDVTGVIADTASAAENLNVGGIAGSATNVFMSDVYNRGKLVAKGKVCVGSSYVGGIAGFYSYPATNIENAYSAAPVMDGGVVGGIVGYLHDGGTPFNVYFDGTQADVEGFGKNYYEGEFCVNCKKNTAYLQSDELVAALNTVDGTTENRNIWVKRGDYPVLSFDSLYKNDSIFFELDDIEVPPKRMVGDSIIYTISTAKQLEFFLSMAGYFNMEDHNEIRVELANDIVMGKDTTHLSKRKLTTDVSYCVRMNFDGNNHTIYGLNMDRAMLYGLTKTSIFQNVTIANSRFENDQGLSAAAVALENAGYIMNVTVRNSLVHGGVAAGGIVVRNILVGDEPMVLKSKNENTTVISTGLAGGIVAQDYCGFVVDNSNSGRVVGRTVGGIVGYKYSSLQWTTGALNNNSNTGMVLASGRDSVMVGGIVGLARNFNVSGNFNSGLVEAVADSGTLYIGGIVGKADSVKFMDSGNWGRIHAESQNGVYAGGIVGAFTSKTYESNHTVVKTSDIFNSFNYGPLNIKSAKDSAIVGGVAGLVNGGTVQGSYNRGSIVNEGASANRFTGGLVAITDSANIALSYSYVDAISGSKVGNIAYELQDWYIADDVYYGSNLKDHVGIVNVPSTPDRKTVKVGGKTFDEMKFKSFTELNGYDGFEDKGCLPVNKNDTTSVCAEKVVADSFGDSEKPYTVGYLLDVVYADSTIVDPPGEGPVHIDPKTVDPKVKLLPMQVEVSARGIAVSGLPENHAVTVFDMRGRLVASARVHGAETRLSIPRAGRYMVRSGSQVRPVTVR